MDKLEFGSKVKGVHVSSICCLSVIYIDIAWVIRNARLRLLEVMHTQYQINHHSTSNSYLTASDSFPVMAGYMHCSDSCLIHQQLLGYIGNFSGFPVRKPVLQDCTSFLPHHLPNTRIITICGVNGWKVIESYMEFELSGLSAWEGFQRANHT